MSEQRFCQYCGSVLEPEWQFCEKCGGQSAVPDQPGLPPEAAPTVFHPPLQVDSTPPPPRASAPSRAAVQPIRSAQPNQKGSRWLMPAVAGCLALLCVCVCISVGAYLLYQRSPVVSAVESTQPIEITPIQPAEPTEPATPTTETIPLEPMATPTAIEMPSATEIPLPTPEPPREELPLTGYQYIDDFSFLDDFSSKALGWAEYDDGITIIQYENETYGFQMTEPGYYDWAYVPADFWPNAIQFDVWALPGPQDGSFGVFCQYQDADNHYYVEIDLGYRMFVIGLVRDGEYIYQTIPDESGDYWLDAAPLKLSPTDVNRIDISCYQDFIVLVINDGLVYSTGISDPFDAPGDMAFFVFANQDAGPEGYKVYFDNVGVQQLDE